MEIQLNDLNKERKKIGLKIHEGKTKYVTDETIEIENEINEKVNRYKYLYRSNSDVGSTYKRKCYDQNKSRMNLFWTI